MPRVNLKVPKRSGFDKSFMNLLTAPVGTIVPILTDELIPNTKVYLKSVLSASLPPLATDTFMRVNLKVEAFFVPTRLLYGGYEQWITSAEFYNSQKSVSYKSLTPILEAKTTETAYIGAGSLADYLGMRGSINANLKMNIYPWLCYHRIYDDWYRCALVQTPVFQRPADGIISSLSDMRKLMYMPFLTISDQSGAKTTYNLSETLGDGVALGALRQRNFGFDYFTSALPNAQQGNPIGITFDTSGAIGTITISSIRAANSLTQFAERKGMSSPRMQDFCASQYGADLSSGVAQRAILLGSGEVAVYSKGIYNNTIGQTTGDITTNNPFQGSVGSKFGSVSCNGELNLVDDFTAQEPGYLMVLASLVPIACYATGLDPMLARYNAQDTQVDMANPLLQNVGNEPIYAREMTSSLNDDTSVFGYSDRFSKFKTKLDQVHGLIRDGQSMQAFALQRSISGTPTIGPTFLEIPTTYLDQVAALSSGISSYGMWLDCFHDYKISMPISQYSIPSLQDPAYEHGRNVNVRVGGSRL